MSDRTPSTSTSAGWQVEIHRYYDGVWEPDGAPWMTRDQARAHARHLEEVISTDPQGFDQVRVRHAS